MPLKYHNKNDDPPSAIIKKVSPFHGEFKISQMHACIEKETVFGHGAFKLK